MGAIAVKIIVAVYHTGMFSITPPDEKYNK
jgi:hypothetical protein